VGVALLKLYSQYLESIVLNSEDMQLQLFVFDQLGDDFAELGKLIRRRIALDDLLAVYRVTERPDTADGQHVLRLEILNPASRRKALTKGLRGLPRSIWVRESLLATEGGATLVTPASDFGQRLLKSKLTSDDIALMDDKRLSGDDDPVTDEDIPF
jgi:hypothetical protein